MSTDLAYLMDAVARRLLGAPNEPLSSERELRYGSKGSLSIDLNKGTYYDWEHKQGGGVLEFIKRYGNADPFAWLRKEGLLPDRPSMGFSKTHVKRDNIPSALAIWHQSVPAAGTLVETYLRSRGITLPPPLTLSFHPSLLHNPTDTYWPAMVALVTREKVILGIHRTYLARDGSGKADVKPKKMMLGPISGGAVRLAPAAESICITEGIEDALSVMQVTGRVAWASGSATGMKNLLLPDIVREVIICADNDPAGENAADKASARWFLEHRYVRIARPPPSKDWNDLLREG